MTLFETPAPIPSPAAAIKVAHTFVGRCRAYAALEIARREADGRVAEEWKSYLRFTDHTLRELEEGTLDDWFREAEEQKAR